MVDRKKISQVFHEYFKISGSYVINRDSGVVDVQGNVKLVATTNAMPVQFGAVQGDFVFCNNRLRTLKGAPHNVGGSFECDNNDLKDLTHAPLHVGDHFVCSNNSITSLKGAPTHVGGDFNCSRNYLTDLTHAPTQVGSFWAYNNKLSNLIGSPLHVSGLFDCSNNPLTSLEGAPDVVEGSFYVNYNPQLPLLRLCNYKKVRIWQAPEPVEDILYRYAGQGRSGALKAAAELIRAGYRENARW